MGILTWSICAIIFGVPSVQGATLRGSSVGNNVVERNHHHRHLDEAVCENAVTGKFKVKGQSTARKCGGFANKNLCENELNDGTGNKVFEVCAKSCDACGTAPTSAPTQFEDNKIECENEKVGKFKVIGVKGKKLVVVLPITDTATTMSTRMRAEEKYSKRAVNLAMPVVLI